MGQHGRKTPTSRAVQPLRINIRKGHPNTGRQPSPSLFLYPLPFLPLAPLSLEGGPSLSQSLFWELQAPQWNVLWTWEYNSPANRENQKYKRRDLIDSFLSLPQSYSRNVCYYCFYYSWYVSSSREEAFWCLLRLSANTLPRKKLRSFLGSQCHWLGPLKKFNEMLGSEVQKALHLKPWPWV